MKKEEKNPKQNDVRVILHNIRSTHNVGSIFRTSDAGGVSRIYISGYTPAPIDKFGKKQKDIAKVALGAEDSFIWEKANDVSKLISNLKKEGFKIIAIEQNKKSIDYRKVKIPNKTVLLVGNEVKGLSSSLLSKCNIVAEIPMLGKKESLNVSVAFGVALFQMIQIY
jgi:tRNA G18 (ribose-2'-O)-methylase SpoU